jgi:hypothetical protein
MIAEWIGENFPAKRLDTGPAIQFYRGDFESDPIAGKLSGAGKWAHLEAIDTARRSMPPGRLEEDALEATVIDLPERDQRLMGMLWREGYNRGTLKTVLALLHTKFSKGRKSHGAKTDPDLITELLRRIEAVAVDRDTDSVTDSVTDPVTGPLEAGKRPVTGSGSDNQTLLQGAPRARVLSSSSSSSSPRGPKKKSREEDLSTCAEPVADDRAAPPADGEIAFWFRVTKGKRPRKSDPFVRPVDGDEHEAAVLNSELADFVGAYPDLDVEGEFRKARLWCQKNRSRRKTPSGLGSFLATWLNRAQNGQGGRRVQPKSSTALGRRTQGKSAAEQNLEWGQDPNNKAGF